MQTIWNISNSSQPKYLAIVDCIEQGISNKHLASGEKLPPHRKLADTLGVTVSTVTRAYTEAEKRGLITSRVGSGSYVMSTRKYWHFASDDADSPMINLSQSVPLRLDVDQKIAQCLLSIQQDATLMSQLMDYQSESSLVQHREIISEWCKKFGHDFNPLQMLLTLGGQHGIYSALQRLAQSEEHVAAAGLSYPGFINAARSLRIRAHAVDLDDQGIIPQALDALCRQYKIKAVYLTPNEHNPTAAQMSVERRMEIVALAEKYDFHIIEDDVNLFDEEYSPKALVSLSPDRVIYIGSMSKILAGGLRMGFMHIPANLYQRFADGLHAQCWMLPTLMSELSCRIISSGIADDHIAKMRKEILQRQRIVDEIFVDIPHRKHKYGYYIWLPLPEHWRAQAFVSACIKQHVRIYNSEIFALANYPSMQAVRICLSGAINQQALRMALNIIKTIYNDPDLSSRMGM